MPKKPKQDKQKKRGVSHEGKMYKMKLPRAERALPAIIVAVKVNMNQLQSKMSNQKCTTCGKQLRNEELYFVFKDATRPRVKGQKRDFLPDFLPEYFCKEHMVPEDQWPAIQKASGSKFCVIGRARVLGVMAGKDFAKALAGDY